MLRVQQWLKLDEALIFRKLLHADVASLQEEAGRLLILAKEDERKVADAKDAGAKANDLIRFIEFMDLIGKGEHEFSTVTIGVSDKILWKS